MVDLSEYAADLESYIRDLGHDATIGDKSIADWIGQAEGQKETQTQVVRLAVCRAVYDLLFTSGRAGFGEEHQTASFMGHLASQIGWYSRLAAAEEASSGNEFNPPDIRWAHQEKTQEAESGVDFGLLCNPSGGKEGNTEVRLILLQAKRSYRDASGIERIKIYQHSGKVSLINKDMLNKCLRGALMDHEETLYRPSLQLIVNSLNNSEKGENCYQLEVLLRTQMKLSLQGTAAGPWCFYVAWRQPISERPPLPPLALSLGNVAKRLKTPNGFNSPITVPLRFNGDQCHDFIFMLAAALGYRASDYGLKIRLDQVKDAVGEACSLLPNLNFITSSSTTDGGIALSEKLQEKDFMVSLPTPRPQAPHPIFTPSGPGPGRSGRSSPGRS